MSNDEALRRKWEAQAILKRARAAELEAEQLKPLTQPRYFNAGQPEGYSPQTCPRCSGTGTVGGSKCPKCAGHGRVYVYVKEES